MAAVTELQAELLAALLNSGVSSETVIQAVRALEKQMKPDCQKLEKIANGAGDERGGNCNVATVEGQNQSIAATLPNLNSSDQSIAEQLMKYDPWQSAKIIKQYMQQHNIPQREAVETTGLNQSHLSQHLNKGTPMKVQKRLTLYKWFEAKQKEIAAQYNSVSGKRLSEHDLSSPYSGLSYKRARRNRFKWGQASTEILYGAYDSQRNPSKEEREALVQACNNAECDQRGIPLEQVNNLGPNLVTESRVYNWFANRRKEEAFKVKLAMDAGTYSAAVCSGNGGGGVESRTSTEAKSTSTTTGKALAPKPLPLTLPTFVAHPLTKFTDSLPDDRESGQRTPSTMTPTTTTSMARLPTMSLIKFEPSPPPVAAQSPIVSYAQQITASTPTVVQRPISVAFGGMPTQILTPTQLQVITGLVPGQMMPISHTTSNMVGQGGEIGTSGSIPSGHVTNLMLPSQLSTQTIPMHAVSLVPMTSGQPQLIYSVTTQSSVLPVSSTSVTMAAPSPSFTSPLSSPSMVTTPSVRNDGTTQLPKITLVHGGASPATHAVSSPLPIQLSSQLVAQGGLASQALQSSTVRSTEIKQEISGLQLPDISHLGTLTQAQSSCANYGDLSNYRRDSIADTSKPREGVGTNSALINPGNILNAEEEINSGNTLVVEMKPVDETPSQMPGSHVVHSSDNPQTDSRDTATVQPLPVSQVAGINEKIGGSERSLNLSENGGVNIERSIGEKAHKAV